MQCGHGIFSIIFKYLKIFKRKEREGFAKDAKNYYFLNFAFLAITFERKQKQAFPTNYPTQYHTLSEIPALHYRLGWLL